MVLVKFDTHCPHILAVADKFLNVILYIDCVILDGRLTISTVIIIDKRNLSSCRIVIKILEFLGWPSKLWAVTKRCIVFLSGWAMLIHHFVLLLKIKEHGAAIIELTLFICVIGSTDKHISGVYSRRRSLLSSAKKPTWWRWKHWGCFGILRASSRGSWKSSLNNIWSRLELPLKRWLHDLGWRATLGSDLLKSSLEWFHYFNLKCYYLE